MSTIVFSFTNQEENAHVVLRGHQHDDGTTWVDTDSVLSAIQDLDDQLLELCYADVNSIVTELIGTLHTALNDPGAASPPDGWVMTKVPEGVLVDQTYGVAEIPEGWVPVQANDDFIHNVGSPVDDEDAARLLAIEWGTEYRYFPGTMSPEGYEYEVGSVEHEPGDWAVRLP